MKSNILGLLKKAQTYLALLDAIKSGESDPSDLQNIDVESTAEILTELIEHIAIVQSDPSQLEDFLRIYCLKNDQSIN